MFFVREQVIPWKRSEWETPEPANLLLAWAAPVPLLAQATPSLTIQVSKAFEPLIQLVQAAGYPICFLMVSGGTLLIMTGNREKGLAMIKNAAVGYLGLQFVPIIMDLLVQVAQAMRTTPATTP